MKAKLLILALVVVSSAASANTKKYRFTGELLQERLRDVSVIWDKPEPMHRFVIDLVVKRKKAFLKIKGDKSKHRISVASRKFVGLSRTYLHEDGCIRDISIRLSRQVGRAYDAVVEQRRECDPLAPHQETPTQSWFDFRQFLIENVPEITPEQLNYIDRSWSYRYVGTMKMKQLRSRKNKRR